MITLTAEEIALIEKFLKKENSDPIGEDAVLMRKITNDALNLMIELDAVSEIGSSLIRWYYHKYKKQLAQ